MRAGTRIILKIRLENRLVKLKELLCGVTNRSEVRRLVAEDWRKAEYAGVGKKEFIVFDFSLDDGDICPPQLPIQYEVSNQ